MTKSHSIKINILVSSVFILSAFLFLFTGRSIFAMDVSPIDLWQWEENFDDKEKLVSLSLTGYLSDEPANCENIIIPNLCDFKQANADRYKNLKEVCISKAVMNSVAKKASQYNGCLKVSDTMDGSVVAIDEDWSNCFNFENNNIKEIDLSRLDTTNVTNMASMFSGCTALEKLDLFGFNTENVEDMGNMFINTGLKIIDLSSFVFKDGVNTEKMFDEVSKDNLLVLSNEQNDELLTELTKNRSAMNLKFIFGEESFHAFEGVVFCPSSIDISRETDENFDDYLNRIIEKCLEIAGQIIKEKKLCSQDSLITWQPEDDYKTVEEKLDGIYRGTAESPSVKLVLNEGTDFKWPEAIKNLKYDGQPKKLVNDGFISEGIKNSGVKFEYSLDKTNWSDQIPTGTDIGIYKIYIRINGSEKYQDVYWVDINGNDYLKIKIYALELQNGIDYKFAQARNDLIYDGREKELLCGGFVNKNIENDGVKIQYSKDGITWNDKIPTAIKAGVYKVYQKINGGKKYQDIFYNVDGKGYIEVKISNSKKKSNSNAWRTIENYTGSSSDSNKINTNNPEFKKLNSDKTLKKIDLPERFKRQKYLSGYPDGQIKPYNNMTHAEFVNMIYKLMYDGKEKINTEKIKNLTDVKISDWYGVGVAYLLDKNIISIKDNSFKPNENITRGEVAEIWFNVLKFYDTEKSKKYDYGDAFYKFADSDKFGKFAEPIKQLASNGIINGYEDKTFKADKNITRAEATKIIFYASGRKSNLGQKIYSDLGKDYWAYKFLMDASA